MTERWEIISLQFEGADQTKTSYINTVLADYPNYEPFDSFWKVMGGVETFTLLLKRKLD